MTELRGSNNWQLTICRGAAGVTILRAVTCDECAALPEELFGLPVTALGDHAFAPEARTAAGEEVRVLGAPGAEPWDNRALRDLTLPARLRGVGDYALLNCRALKTLRLTDGEITWGTGVLMNCRALDSFMVDGTGGTSVAYFAGELNRELDVSLLDGGAVATRLIFPEYTEEYEENGPAHHFDYKVYGAGQPYHHAFCDRRLNLYDYDALWPKFLAGECDADTALHLAWWRVYYPMQLSNEAAARYRNYLAAHADAALRFLLSQRDTAMLAAFLRDVGCGAEALHAAVTIARENRDTAALALLLEELHRKSGAGKTFEL